MVDALHHIRSLVSWPTLAGLGAFVLLCLALVLVRRAHVLDGHAGRGVPYQNWSAWRMVWKMPVGWLQKMLWSIVLVALLGLMAGCPKDARRMPVNDKAAMGPLRAFFGRHYPPPDHLSEDEKAVVKDLFSRALGAFTNGTPGGVFGVLPALTSRVECVVWEEYRSLSRDFDAAFNRCCLYRPVETEFNSVEDFARYLDTCMEAVRFKAELELCRVWNAIMASNHECWMLHRLYGYRDHYLRLENSDFVRCVESRIADWEGLIESEQGLSLRAARRSLALSQARRDEVGDLTPQQVVGSARVHAQGLVNVGYTPRWLEREFPRAQLETTLAE